MSLILETQYSLSLQHGPKLFLWNGSRINDLLAAIELVDTNIRPMLNLTIVEGTDNISKFMGFGVKAIDMYGICIKGDTWDQLTSIHNILEISKTEDVLYVNGLFFKAHNALPAPTYLVELGKNHGKITLDPTKCVWTFCDPLGIMILSGETITLESSVAALQFAFNLHDEGYKI